MFVDYSSQQFELIINKFHECKNDDLFEFERDLLKKIHNLFKNDQFLLMENTEEGDSFFEFLDQSLKIYHINRNSESMNDVLGSWLRVNQNYRKEAIQAFSTMLALDIRELEIRELRFKNNFFNSFLNFKNFVLDNFYKFSDFSQTYLQASFFYLPKKYYSELFVNPAINNLKEIIDKSTDSDLILSTNIKKLNEELIPSIAALESKLKASAALQNFVELNKAFSKLFDEKKLHKKTLDKNARFYKGLLFLVPCIEICLLATLLFFNVNFFDGGRWALLVIPSITIILVSLYYLKISLHDLKVIELQIFDLETRMALCAFIDSYADKANELKTEKNISGLILFESMIFSPIYHSKDPSPNIFDGADQIAKLIEAMKK